MFMVQATPKSAEGIPAIPYRNKTEELTQIDFVKKTIFNKDRLITKNASSAVA